MKEYDERCKERALWPLADLIEEDSTKFEEQLDSKSSALYYELCPGTRKYCQAQFCLPSMLSGRPTIESSFRFNLRDLTNKHIYNQLLSFLVSGPLTVEHSY
jgi:hypothetical protein